MAVSSRTPSQARLRIGFILSKRFTLCAFATFVDVLRLAADEGDRSRPILCEWAILSDTMEPVVSSCGVAVQPGMRLGDPAGFDYVVVVGGLIEEVPSLSGELTRFLRRAAELHVPLVGVCTGGFILHQVGLMDGYRCCVSWFHHADFLERFDGLVPISDRIFVVDRDRLTCSGGVSSAQLAAHLVERHVGPGAARKSLEIMMIDEAPSPETPQPGIPTALATADGVVQRTLHLMRQNIETPLTVDELARRIGTPRRSLERHFANALQRTPAECYVAMRLDQADLLMRTSGRSIAAIAVATGFCDTTHFARVYRRKRGTTPTRSRVAT